MIRNKSKNGKDVRIRTYVGYKGYNKDDNGVLGEFVGYLFSNDV